MCGICGIVGFEDADLIKRMCDKIVHRGPDDFGYFIDENICLGNRRLAIIDISGGHQPLSNEEGDIWITYNGEVYNFQQLKNDLEKKGHIFKTNCDTEVIVHAYEEYDLSFVDKLRGMFAFAIWDSRKRRVILARDRIGIKPLYYTWVKNNFIFASEIKSILEYEEVSRELNTRFLEEYLRFRCVFSPNTLFKHIFKLRPGTLLEIALEERTPRVSVRRYWKLPKKMGWRNTSFAKALATVEKLVKEAVAMRLIADVPLGVFLSGGIDSSYITLLAAQLIPETLKTFSIGFEEEEYSELRYARAVADYLETDHHEFILSEESIKLLPEIVWHFDEPVADPAAIPTYILSRETRKYVTVVLTGEGGDELAGGYEQYKIFYASKKVRPLLKAIAIKPLREISEKIGSKLMLSPLSKQVDNVFPRVSALGVEGFRRLILYSSLFASEDYLNSYIELTSVFDSKDLCNVLKTSDANQSFFRLYPSFSKKELIESLMFIETRYHLADNLLMKIDKMTMAHSLEARVPYLDHVIAEYFFSLPTKFKILQIGTRIEDKYILRHLLREHSLSAIARRRKHRFVVPIGEWLSSKDYIHIVYNLITEDLEKYVNNRYLKKVARNYDGSSLYFARQLWSLLTLSLWYKEFVEGTSITQLSSYL